MSDLNPSNQEHLQDDEISLKEVILKIKEYYRDITKSWFILLLFLIPIVALMAYQAISTPITYTSKFTFMVNEDEGGSVNPVSSILGSLGFGGGAKSTFNLDKILELSTSFEIIQQALFEKANINGTDDYFANHIINEFEYEEEWKKKDKNLDGFRFSSAEFEKFGKKENWVLKYIYKKIKGSSEADIEGMFSTKYGAETGIMEMEMKTIQEDISVLFIRTIYNKLSEFYISQSTEKSLNTYLALNSKVDSLKKQLEFTESSLARFDDSNRGLRTNVGAVKRDRLQRNLTILGIAYGKAIENKEISEFGLNNSTPFFQEVDGPIYPLEPQSSSLITNIILGGIIGLFLGVLFIIVRKVIRDTMQEV